jgi:hypothetical protein
MEHGKRRMLVACLLILGLAGCATTSQVRLKDEIERLDSRVNSYRGQAVAGYVDAAAFYHEFDGFVRIVPGDSLEFVRAVPGAVPGTSPVWADLKGHPFRLPRDRVSTIFIRHIDPLRTTLAVIGTTVLVLGVAVAIAIATKESCPFIYSWDGTQYVFDGEPYGGAIMSSLERTDWSELEHLIPDHGRYRLQLTNEVDETQHTNSLELLVVDHPRGTTAVMDKEGRPHAFRSLEHLSAASDENGADLLPWLRENDRVAWYPDLAALSLRDSIADTRNHITLEFVLPRGREHAYLISNLATGQWGSHMIRDMLAMRGSRVGDFYAAIGGSELSRRQLLDWSRREELFELSLEVKVGDHWVHQDFIPGGGPFVSENRAIPVDLSGVTGDRVQIRIHPPIGFWSLNSFMLGWGEEAVRVTTVEPDSGTGPEGVDVVRALRSVDSSYVDFPTKAEHATLAFVEPPATPGMERTVFAQTRGWYEIHLHDLGASDPAALGRLAYEPGYVVRRGLQELGDFRRTGALRGVPAVPAGSGVR